MRRIITLLVLMIFVFNTNLSAKFVEKTTAEKVAVNFLFEKTNTFKTATPINNFTIEETYLSGNSVWVVNFEQGWVLVAADDAMVPVIGYNYENNFLPVEKQDQSFQSWMQYFADQVNYIHENNLVATETIVSEWEKYETGNPEELLARNTRDEVAPLTTSLWDQPNPYNLMCPVDPAGPGGHALVGCVATTMSQLMYYWRYPLQGTGQHSYYESPYGTISANFGASTYDWNAMKNSIDANNPWEIAEISFQTGVSVDMGYGPDASGAYTEDVPYALKTYFKYGNSVQMLKKNNYTTSVWESMMQGELNISHPLYYSGQSTDGGHAFVCDGYQGTNYYHFNFGWSGSQNGYYTLQDVNGFYSDQRMVRNIVPGDANYPYIANGEYNLLASSGSFSDGSGPAANYPSGMDASWLISPQNEMDSISSITLNFIQFATSSNDYVKVYAGPTTGGQLLGSFSGNNLPNSITYPGNQMLITFSSGGSNEGFLIEYTTTRPSWCTGTQAFTEPSGTITDGSGDFYYNNGSACMFMINNPEAVKITLEFTEMNTEAGKDIITIYDVNSNVLATYSGNEIPEPLEVNKNLVLIAWSTNSTINGPGWALNYMIDGVGINELAYENLQVYPNPVTNELNVKFNLEKSSALTVRIINMSGQIVREETTQSFSGEFKSSFDLSNEAKGVYLLSIISDKGKVDKKIIVK